jgi:hypothetical protein
LRRDQEKLELEFGQAVSPFGGLIDPLALGMRVLDVASLERGADHLDHVVAEKFRALNVVAMVCELLLEELTSSVFVEARESCVGDVPEAVAHREFTLETSAFECVKAGVDLVS